MSTFVPAKCTHDDKAARWFYCCGIILCLYLYVLCSAKTTRLTFRARRSRTHCVYLHHELIVKYYYKRLWKKHNVAYYNIFFIYIYFRFVHNTFCSTRERFPRRLSMRLKFTVYKKIWVKVIETARVLFIYLIIYYTLKYRYRRIRCLCMCIVITRA